MRKRAYDDCRLARRSPAWYHFRLLTCIWHWYVLLDDRRDLCSKGKYETCDQTNWPVASNVGNVCTRFRYQTAKIHIAYRWFNTGPSERLFQVWSLIGDYQSLTDHNVLSDIALRKIKQSAAKSKALTTRNQSFLSLINDFSAMKTERLWETC